MRFTLRVAVLCLILPLGLHPARSQETHDTSPADTVARVPALDRFHEVIAVIWHEAWPKKDTERLLSLLPDVKAGVESVAAAKLPGMMREKRGAWERGVAELRGASEGYAEAAKARDADRLLKAAEMLHARYEGLVRVLRPVLKEIDDFHASLYILYHTYLPRNAIDSIARVASDLKAKMARLDDARLPERYKSRSDAFGEARKNLGAAVASLNAAVLTRNEPAVREAVESVHARYESLVHVFAP